jgi:hypothetical protein
MRRVANLFMLDDLSLSLLEYAIMNMAHDLNIPQFLYNPKDHMRHEQPSTKISLQWDENGDEWIIDAYINNYF